MKGIKRLKTLVFIVAFCICVGALANTAYAKTKYVYEVEPNDTMDTAQELEPNKTTAATTSAGTENVNMLYGNISLGDQDWYKVYFKSGRQYISLSSGKDEAIFKVVLYKENGEVIDEWTHDESYKGRIGYDYDLTEGYYYVKIIGVPSYSGSYNLSVGDPEYYIGGDHLTLDSVTMSGGTAKTVSFDWSNRLDIPKDAVVDVIMLSDVRSTEAASVTYECVASRKSIKTVLYPWHKRDLCDYNLKARSKWNITFGYKKNVTFTPYVSIQYFYPIGRDGKMKK